MLHVNNIRHALYLMQSKMNPLFFAVFFCSCRQWRRNINWMFQKQWMRFWTCQMRKVNKRSYDSGLFLSWLKFSFVHLHIISNIFHLNYTVRRANVPEMLNEDYISDVDEGISYFVWFVLIAPASFFLFFTFSN